MRGTPFRCGVAGQVLLQVAVALEDALGVLGEPVGIVRGRLQHGDRVVRPAPRLGRQRLEQRPAWPGSHDQRRLYASCSSSGTRSSLRLRTRTAPSDELTRLGDFGCIWHVWFRVPRGHPHEYTVQPPMLAQRQRTPTTRHASGCVHDLPAWLREAMWIGSEEVVATSLARRSASYQASARQTPF